MRATIVSGRLRAGDRLPPSREVAVHLGVSRHTVTTVYGRLAAEGFIEGRAGGGSFVCPAGRSSASGRRPDALRPVTPFANPEFAWSGVPVPPPARLDLRPGMLDPALFPVADWRRAMTTAMQTAPVGYGSPAGLPELRDTLARWIRRERGVDADAEQVVVTSGAQQAISLVLRLLVGPGDVIAVEDPGYPPVRRLSGLFGASVEPVPVDEQGIVVEQIPARARVVYTTPSHQSPTGVTMSLERRRALLAFANANDVAVIEDDYDSAYRHVNRPLEPLYRLDEDGRVVYVATFSKILAPSLRLGFMVMPLSLVPAAVNLRRLLDWQPPTLLQEALLHFITDGLLEKHLRRTRRAYSERHGIITEWAEKAAVDELLGEVTSGNAGLHITALLPPWVDESLVKDDARARGVAIGGLRDLWAGGDAPGGLVLGFGAVSNRELDEALGILRSVLRNAAR